MDLYSSRIGDPSDADGPRGGLVEGLSLFGSQMASAGLLEERGKRGKLHTFQVLRGGSLGQHLGGGRSQDLGKQRGVFREDPI